MFSKRIVALIQHKFPLTKSKWCMNEISNRTFMWVHDNRHFSTECLELTPVESGIKCQSLKITSTCNET